MQCFMFKADLRVANIHLILKKGDTQHEINHATDFAITILMERIKFILA